MQIANCRNYEYPLRRTGANLKYLTTSNLIMTSAYLLVTHGSRDPRPQIAAERLAYLVQQQLITKQQPSLPQSLAIQNRTFSTTVRSSTAILPPPSSLLIETASLELSPVSLSQQIQQFADQAKSLRLQNLKIIPLFLLPGVHVREDIPKEVAIAQQQLGKTITLELSPYLGSNPRLPHLLARQFRESPTVGKILIAHGSRYRGGNQPIESMANCLQALAAYWSVSPSLTEQIDALVEQGKETITIVPYFLFAGGITTAIAQQVQQLQRDLPQIQLQMGSPLGATPELAQLIVEGMENDK